MALTRDQIKQNIVSMEQQGAPQADIQSYLDSLKGQQQPAGMMGRQTEEPKDGLLKTIAKDIARPPATLLARPFQVGKAIAGKEDLGVDLPFGLGRAEAPTSARDVVGDVGRALQTASLGVGGAIPKIGAGLLGKTALGRGAQAAAGKIATAPGAIPVAQRAATGQVPIRQLTKEGIGIGAKGGAMFGAGVGLEEEGTLGSALKQGAIGTGFGAVGGAIIPAAIRGAGRAIFGRPVDVDRLVGQITQGTKQQAKKSREALQSIDTSGIKTYSDLVSVPQKKVSELARTQDRYLSGFTKIFRKNELSTPIQVGEKTVKKNYVQSGIDQLKKHYQKSENITGLNRIKQLETKMNSAGLTVREINDLAREHGTEIASRAFGVTGEPLTGVNKIAYENIRKGLKEAARNKLPSERSKILDKEMSNLYTLISTAKRMEKAVNTLSNKVKDRRVFEMIGRLTGRAVDMMTLGAAKGFIASLFPSNIGLKTMNSLDLERSLASNLKLFERANKTGRVGDIREAIKTMIKTFAPGGKKKSQANLGRPLKKTNKIK